MQCSHTRRRSVPLFSPRCSLLTKKTDLLSKSARGDTRGRGEVRVDEYGAVRTGQGHAVRERCLLAAPDDALVLVEQSARAPWCTIWSTLIYGGRRVTSRSLMSAHQLCRSATSRAPLRVIASSSSVPSSILSSTRVGLMLVLDHEPQRRLRRAEEWAELLLKRCSMGIKERF